MPKFTSKAVLTKGGAVYGHGKTIDLTEEQAKRLGDKVGPYEAPTTEDFIKGDDYDEVSFRKLSADDQKKVVAERGGNLEEITNADARWAFVSGE